MHIFGIFKISTLEADVKTVTSPVKQTQKKQGHWANEPVPVCGQRLFLHLHCRYRLKQEILCKSREGNCEAHASWAQPAPLTAVGLKWTTEATDELKQKNS